MMGHRSTAILYQAPFPIGISFTLRMSHFITSTILAIVHFGIRTLVYTRIAHNLLRIAYNLPREVGSNGKFPSYFHATFLREEGLVETRDDCERNSDFITFGSLFVTFLVSPLDISVDL